jgi:hypothetical protein
MITPKNKAMRLVNAHGFKAAYKIAHEMTNEIGWLALMAPTKEISDDYKNIRFYWDTVKEIVQKEEYGSREDL